jgi:hypothetical protein
VTDARHAPATARNREPILAVLREVLPETGLVLEVASGTGEHVRFFAEALPGLDWQPSDPDPDARASIVAWCGGVPNIHPPLALDAAAPDWPIAAAHAVLCINMVHISPWAATEGLFAGASRLLAPGAPLYLYGPYRRADVPTAPSNEAFEASLKARDPAWGLRDLADVIAAGDRDGLRFERLVEMPANNLSLVFRRS